jgi:hypothetical protein
LTKSTRQQKSLDGISAEAFWTRRGILMVQQEPIRYTVIPRDIPAKKAARRLHLTEKQFWDCFEELLRRGFPDADPTTGMFDLHAIECWMDNRHERATDSTRSGQMDCR